MLRPTCYCIPSIKSGVPNLGRRQSFGVSDANPGVSETRFREVIKKFEIWCYCSRGPFNNGAAVWSPDSKKAATTITL